MENYNKLDIKELDTLEDLVDFLGFVETSEMLNLRKTLTEHKLGSEDLRSGYIEYERLAIEKLEIENEASKKTYKYIDKQIGLLLIKTIIIKESVDTENSEDIEYYKDEIKDIKRYLSGLIPANNKYIEILESLNKLTQ